MGAGPVRSCGSGRWERTAGFGSRPSRWDPQGNDVVLPGRWPRRRLPLRAHGERRGWAVARPGGPPGLLSGRCREHLRSALQWRESLRDRGGLLGSCAEKAVRAERQRPPRRLWARLDQQALSRGERCRRPQPIARGTP